MFASTSAKIKVANAVKGYCDIHNIIINIFTESDIDGETISHFRIAGAVNDSVILRWKEATEKNLDGAIAHICEAIYADWSRSKLDRIGISHEMELLRHFAKPSDKKPDPTPEISKVIFNNPCTIVLWSDKTKTIVRCQEGDVFDPEKGLAMAIVKKMSGNTGKYYDIFKKWVPKEKNPNNFPKYPWSFDTMTLQFAMERLQQSAKATSKSAKELLNSLYGAPKQETGLSSVDKTEKKGE